MTLHNAPPARFLPGPVPTPRPRDPWIDGPDLGALIAKLRVRRGALLIALAAGAGLGLALGSGLSTLRPSVYTASTELMVAHTSLQLSGPDAALTQMLVDGSIIQSQIELARSNGVLERTVERLGPEKILALAPAPTPTRAALSGALRAIDFRQASTAPATAETLRRAALGLLREQSSVRRVGASQLVTLSVTAGTAAAAADAANALAQDLLDEQREMTALVTTSGALRDRIRSVGPSLRVISKALPPERPAGRGALFLAALGAVGLGLAFALARAAALAFDDRIVTVRQLAALGFPCFGNVPRLRTLQAGGNGRSRRHDPVRAAHQPSMLVNVLRLARTAALEQAAGRPHLIGLTSCAAGEGKTTMALSLARLLAGEGQRVLLVDAASPDALLTQRLAPEAALGVGEALRDAQAFRSVVVRDIRPNLDFLPGGGQGSDLDALWPRGPRAWAPADRQTYDWMVFDLPALNPSVEIRSAGVAMDHLLIVAGWGLTRAGDLAASIEALGPVADRIVGTILNMAPLSALSVRETANNDLRRMTPVPRKPPQPRQAARAEAEAMSWSAATGKRE